MGVITATLVAGVIIFFIALLVETAYKKPLNFPPGPPSLPHFGGFLFYKLLDRNNPASAFMKLSKFYKTDILGLYANSTFLLIVANSYESIRELFYNTSLDGRVDSIVARTRSFDKLFGIFFTDGIFWHIQRRFSLRYLRDFGFGRRCPALEGVLENAFKEMIELKLEGPKYDFEKEIVKGDLVNLPHYMNPVFINGMLYVLARTVIERKDLSKLYELSKAGLQFQRSTDDLGGAVALFPYLANIFPKWAGIKDLKASTKVFETFFRDIIEKVENTHDDQSEDRHFVDMYIKKMKDEVARIGKSTFSKDQLVMTCIDYTFPAATANAQTIMMIFDHMFMNPSIQDKVHEEIDRVIGRNRMITLDDRKDLPYTEAVIRETMRYESIVNLAIPHRALNDTRLGDYFIPENAIVVPNLVSLNHDKKIWGDPENFRPERFIVDGKLCLQKDKSLPFGAGKRLCAGETYARQSIFYIFACLMQAFDVTTADGKRQTQHKERIPGIIVTLPDFWVKLTPRK